MRFNIANITDESQWAGLLQQSPYSWHGHSMEYQKIIQMNDSRRNQWFNILITIEDEQYLFPFELFSETLLSHDKYYAGLIPITTAKNINGALLTIKDIAKKWRVKKMVFSYLETDKVGEIVSLNLCQKLYSQQWHKASIMKVDKNYEEIWQKIYDSKTRNMVRKSQKELEFRIINILDYVGDAVDCTWSKPERHGSIMPVYYRDEGLFRQRQTQLAEILSNDIQKKEQAISFGAFYKGKLIAYINTIRSYHEAIISNLLSHAKYWQYAPNNGLFDFMIQHYCKNEGINQLMYSFDGVDSVDKFKHSMGFHGIPVVRCLFKI
jgi:hypothetical protein